MARPGGGGGSHRSSGGHSSHRSGGGHRVSSSRPSSRSSSSSSRSSFSSGRSHYSSHSSNYYVHNSYNSYGNYGKGFNNMSTMSKSNKTLFAKLFMFSVVFFAILMILIELFVCTYEGSGVTNTKNREKLTETTKFDSDCILDEENWISSQTKVKDGLEYFYDKTGIEPYVAILSYDSQYVTDSEREQHAFDMYDELFDDEYHFLYVYYAESDPEQVGYMCYVNGKQVDSIMDDEAIDIYWGYVDKYFYSDLSEDDMFVKIYKDTADKIMTRTTTGADIANKFILLLIIITVIIGVVVIIALVRKSQREKAEETERILNTPVEKIRDESLKDLENKYK